MLRRSIRYSPGAQHDLRTILGFSIKRWGEVHARKHYFGLDRAIQNLAEFSFGSAGTSPGSTIEQKYYRPHWILYRVDDSVVTILRIINERQTDWRSSMNWLKQMVRMGRTDNHSVVEAHGQFDQAGRTML